jgi:hypothetical protein
MQNLCLPFKLVALSFVLLSISNIAAAQAVSRESLQKDIAQSAEMIFQGKYTEAIDRFKALGEKYPQSPSPDFYQAVSLTWQSYVDARLETGKRSLDAQINTLLDSTIKKAETLNARPGKSKEDEIEALYCLGSANAMRSRMNVFQNNALPAARMARAAQDYLNALIKLDPNYSDAYFSAGSIYYRVGLLTDSPLGRAATSLLGAKALPEGNRERGLEYLKIAADKGQVASADARLALLEIYTFNENKFEDALVIARELQTKYPDNQTFARYLMKIYSGLKDKAKLTQTARQVIAQVKSGKPNFSQFLQIEAEKYLAEARKM